MKKLSHGQTQTDADRHPPRTFIRGCPWLSVAPLHILTKR
jgi:hypothetical protein